MSLNKCKILNVKCNTGITLITLIITVIVLLILAGVTISISLNSDNLFSKTNIAKENWNDAADEEEQLINDVYNYIGLTIPDELKFGDIVKWKPSGNYEWNVQYYADNSRLNSSSMTKKLYSGTEVPNGAVCEWQEGESRIDDIDMSIESWKVLKIDKNSNTVTLVPAEPTTSIVRLLGAQGYNNGVKLLNDACHALYGGNIIGVEVHCINMADIESLIKEVPEYKNKYNDNTGFENFRNEDGSYKVNKVYPTIYEDEELSEIDGDFLSTGLGTNDARSTFITRENSSKTANIGIHPTNTHYTFDNADLANALEEYADLILPKGENTKYWIASRSIKVNDKACGYFVRFIFQGALDEPAALINSASATTNTFSIACELFPIVTINSGEISNTENEGVFRFNPLN